MKNKIEQLSERILTLNNMLGELDTENSGGNSGLKIEKDRFKNLMEAIAFLQKKIMDIGTYQLKEASKKCKIFLIIFNR